jgi:hypothetical protein
MLSNSVKPISIYNVAHLTGLAYPSAFSSSNIQYEFCIIDLNKFLSSYVTDRSEPAFQESANEVDQLSLARIEEYLPPRVSNKMCILDHWHQLQLLSPPESHEEIQQCAKAQPKQKIMNDISKANQGF